MDGRRRRVAGRAVFGAAFAVFVGGRPITAGGLDGRYEDVAASKLADSLQGLFACPLANREHRHYASDAEDHAEHRQEGAELVAEDVLHTRPDKPEPVESLH